MDLAEVVAALEALDLEHAPPAALVPLLAACAGTEARIAVRLATAWAEISTPPPMAPETFISVKAAAARLGVAPKWLYRRKKTLPFMREIVPGTWRVSVAALERWMAGRRPSDH
jgi:alkanesulfonate monooxygenase SsuD/methylene tetrahydromethanopterin reductase-like flavin-dependent oxidoreductase (luciferase family)